jgi:hypothetical protein
MNGRFKRFVRALDRKSRLIQRVRPLVSPGSFPGKKLRLFASLTFLIFVAVIPLCGCLFRTYSVAFRASTTPLQTATPEALIERFNAEAEKIQTLGATITISIAQSTNNQSGRSRLPEIRASVLVVRDPISYRATGVMVARNHAFNSTGNDEDWRRWMFSPDVTTGSNDAADATLDKVLQSQIIFDALLLQPINLQREFAVLEQGNHTVVTPGSPNLELQPDYTIYTVNHGARGYCLSRKTLFYRTDLQPHEQILFDEAGSVLSDVWYDQYEKHGDVAFPTKIRIWRPAEGIRAEIKIANVSINNPALDAQSLFETYMPALVSGASRPATPDQE